MLSLILSLYGMVTFTPSSTLPLSISTNPTKYPSFTLSSLSNSTPPEYPSMGDSLCQEEALAILDHACYPNGSASAAVSATTVVRHGPIRDPAPMPLPSLPTRYMGVLAACKATYPGHAVYADQAKKGLLSASRPFR